LAFDDECISKDFPFPIGGAKKGNLQLFNSDIQRVIWNIKTFAETERNSKIF